MTSAVPLILSETRLRRFRPFGAAPQQKAGVATVVATNGGEVRLVPDRRTLGELAFAPHATQYEVDLAHHQTTFAFKLRSNDDGYHFEATVEVTWRVHDPVQVVRHRIVDGTEAVRQQLRGRMVTLGRRYDIEHSRELEEAIRAEFEGPGRLLDECLWVHDLIVEISLDEAGQNWLRERRNAIREGILIRETHGVDVEKQRLAQELERMRAEWEIKQEELRRNFELETKRLQQEQELARQQQEKQQELEAERQRSQFFTEAMERGDAAVLAAHLGRNPDDAKDLVRMIIENKAVAEERQAKLLAEMIDNGMILPAELEGVSAELIRTVMGLVKKQSGGVFALTKILDVPVAELTQHGTDGAADIGPTDTVAARRSERREDEAQDD